MQRKPRVEPQTMAAWQAFLNAHAALIWRIEERLAAAGHVPLSSYDVLYALSQAPGRRLRMGEVAERVVLSRSGLTRLADRLEREGLISREASLEDRRGTYVALTEAGMEALRRAWPVYAQAINELFAAHLDPAQTAALSAALGRVYGAAKGPPNPHDPQPALP